VVGDANQEFYGLAWSGVAVPEPISLVLLTIATMTFGYSRHSCHMHRLAVS